MKQYKIVNGISFEENTNDRVIEILLDAINRRDRIRVFYGDAKSGRDWCEIYDTIGTVGKYRGITKVSLMIYSNRSMNGSPIFTENIVKITKDKKVIYQHPKYSCNVSINDKCNIVSNGKAIIYYGDDPIKTQSFLDYLKGERNNY